MNRYNILLTMAFATYAYWCHANILFRGHVGPQNSADHVWFLSEMRDNARRCNNGFYTGMSAQNIDQRMSQRCEKLDDGNSVCAVEAIDTSYTTERRYDPVLNKYFTQNVTVTHYCVFMINTYINDKGHFFI